MSENPVPQEQGATTLDFTGITIIGFSGGAGITSINGDATPAQILQAPDLSLTIVDLGGGTHNIRVRLVFQTQSTGVVAVTIPPGVETTLLTDVVSLPGFYIITLNVFPATGLTGSTQVRARIYNNAAVICEQITQCQIGVNVDGYAASIVSYLVFYGGGETITSTLLSDAAGAFDVFATLNILRLASV